MWNWLLTLRSPPTGSCWKEKKTGETATKEVWLCLCLFCASQKKCVFSPDSGSIPSSTSRRIQTSVSKSCGHASFPVIRRCGWCLIGRFSRKIQMWESCHGEADETNESYVQMIALHLFSLPDDQVLKVPTAIKGAAPLLQSCWWRQLRWEIVPDTAPTETITRGLQYMHTVQTGSFHTFHF